MVNVQGRSTPEYFERAGMPDMLGRMRLDTMGLPGTSAAISRAAQALSEYGVCEGDLILYQAPQMELALPLFWAAISLGAVFVPIDAGWPEALVDKAAGRLRPKLVAALPDRLPSLQRLFPESVSLALVEEARCEALFPDHRHRPGHAALTIDGAAPAAYLFTSGSTGTPKAVVLSRDSLANGARVTVSSFGWKAGEKLVNLPEPHTMSGLRNALVAAPAAGLDWLPVPIAAKRDLFALCDWLAAARCDRLVTGPALVRQLVLMGERLPKGVFAGLKAIYSTGAALSPASARAFHERHHVPVINYYGLTETGGLCLSHSLEFYDPADASVGVPVGCEVRLIAHGAVHPDEGELQIMSPQLMSAYLDDPERTAARFDGGWLRTGDIMRRDGQGRFHLIGRSELFIKTGSTDRIHPEEVEAVLEEHDQVAEAAVVGMRSESGLDQLVALVVRRLGQGAESGLAIELARFVEQRIGRGRTPNRIDFVLHLPRTANGKLVRASLAGLIA